MMIGRRLAALRYAQKGTTLVVGLIMLVLCTLLVLASFQLGKSNLVIVGNEQRRIVDGAGAAQQTIEAAVSLDTLTSNPTNIFPNPCGAANTLCYDVNGDGTDDVTVALTPAPTCVKAQTIKNTSLNLAIEADRDCALGAQQGGWGIEGAPNSDSKCSNSLWDVRAEAREVAIKKSSVVNQGIGVRVETDDIATSCP